MEEGLKKRLVGAAVLASLAVIFVPMLVEEPVEDKAELVRTPPAPKAKPFESSLLREEVVAPAVIAPPSRRKLVDTSNAEPAGTSTESGSSGIRTGLSAWVVQVGSFSNEENARKLVKKLRRAGFQTRDPEPIVLKGKQLYRVQVGPVLEKKRAEAMLPKINKLAGTRGSVRTYP